MSFEGLGEMFEGGSAGMCTGKFGWRPSGGPHVCGPGLWGQPLLKPKKGSFCMGS